MFGVLGEYSGKKLAEFAQPSTVRVAGSSVEVGSCTGGFIESLLGSIVKLQLWFLLTMFAFVEIVKRSIICDDTRVLSGISLASGVVVLVVGAAMLLLSQLKQQQVNVAAAEAQLKQRQVNTATAGVVCEPVSGVVSGVVVLVVGAAMLLLPQLKK